MHNLNNVDIKERRPNQTFTALFIKSNDALNGLNYIILKAGYQIRKHIASKLGIYE